MADAELALVAGLIGGLAARKHSGGRERDREARQRKVTLYVGKGFKSKDRDRIDNIQATHRQMNKRRPSYRRLTTNAKKLRRTLRAEVRKSK